MSQPIRVQIVDDSAVVRQVLTGLLNQASGIEVIGASSDPVFAMKAMEKQWPDVIVLDVEMPRMDGITFLKKLMAERPTPVVICSTLTQKGGETAMQAMAAGAVSIVSKPNAALKQFLQDSASDIAHAVKAAAQAKLGNLGPHTRPAPAPAPAAAGGAGPVPGALAETTDHVIAIGTSTGGTQALEAILTALPPSAPGIVIVQHMPEKFTGQFAERMNALCRVSVREARNNERIIRGQVLIAPGGRHLRLHRSGAQYRVEVFDGPVVNRHKPSVDVLFRAVAQSAGANAAGFLLTGMGDDGARGLKAMCDAGATTFAQDEATSVVFGMPREAIALNAAAEVLPLQAMPEAIMRFA